MKVGFTPRQVLRLTGIPYSTLNLWAKTGLVRPSISPGVGSGTERVYDFGDLIALKVAFELRKSGFTTRSLRKVIDFLRKNEGMEAPLAEARLIVSGRDVLIVRGKDQLCSVLQKPGQGCLSFVVDLSRTLGDLASAIDSPSTIGMGFLRSQEPATNLPRKQPRSALASPERKRSSR